MIRLQYKKLANVVDKVQKNDYIGALDILSGEPLDHAKKDIHTLMKENMKKTLEEYVPTKQNEDALVNLSNDENVDV